MGISRTRGDIIVNPYGESHRHCLRVDYLAHRELGRTLDGLAAARARGRVGGRPSVMTRERVAAAHVALVCGQSRAAVAPALDVSRDTLYRCLAALDLPGASRVCARPTASISPASTSELPSSRSGPSLRSP